MLPEALKVDDIIKFPPLPSHTEVGFYAAINGTHDSREAGAGVVDQVFAWPVNV